MNSFEKELAKRTGYLPSQCKCNSCKKQCLTPCLGTPEDIIALLDAGYKDNLMATFWCVGVMHGFYPHPIMMVQAIRTKAGCIFFKDGLCQLHDLNLKPTEGRFSSHIIPKRKQVFANMLSWNIAKVWLLDDNISKIKYILDTLSEKSSPV